MDAAFLFLGIFLSGGSQLLVKLQVADLGLPGTYSFFVLLTAFLDIVRAFVTAGGESFDDLAYGLYLCVEGGEGVHALLLVFLCAGDVLVDNVPAVCDLEDALQ